MKHLFPVLATLMTLMTSSTVLAADIQGNYAIWGVGMTSCNQYIIAREAQDDVKYKQYVMGYLTAYNSMAENTYRVSGFNDLNSILSWMDETCIANRVHGFETSLKMYTEVMHEKRLKTPQAQKKRKGW